MKHDRNRQNDRGILVWMTDRKQAEEVELGA